MKPKHDPEGEILALGWDTEYTTSWRMRAVRGTSETGWKSTWEEVLDEVKLLRLAEQTGNL